MHLGWRLWFLNLPAIAAKTLQNFITHPVLGGVYKNAKMQLARMFTPILRAKWSHKQIDHHITQLFADPAVRRHSSCKKGCSACCHSQVSISADEAKMLAQKVVRGEVKIDLVRLAMQAQAGNEATKWYQISFKERACVFLDGKGECTVYSDRPGVCRTNYAVTAAELCSTEDGIEKPMRLLNTQAADMVLAAAFQASKGGGALPAMLWEEVEKASDTKRSKKNKSPSL